MFILNHIVWLSVTLLFLSACSIGETVKSYFGGTDNAEPPSPLVEFTATADVDLLWQRNVGKGTNELLSKLSPVILGSRIFSTDINGNVMALNAGDGKIVWRRKTRLPVTGGPGADENLVMLGTSEGEVISLSNTDGKEVWRASVSSEVVSSPRESDGIVVVRTGDEKIIALSAETGERLWVYDQTVPVLSLRGTSAPVIADNILVAGFDNGQVAALSLKTGKLFWEKMVAISDGRSELERMVDIDTRPLIVGGIVYVAAFQANVTALFLDSGQILWQRNISSYTDMAADTAYLYVTDDQSHVWALDRFTGESIWKQEKLQRRNVSAPAVAGNKIVVGDLEGYLHWLDKDSGHFVARNRVTRDPISAQPLVAGETVYVYSNDARLSAFFCGDNNTIAPTEEEEDTLGIPSSFPERLPDTLTDENETTEE